MGRAANGGNTRYGIRGLVWMVVLLRAWSTPAASMERIGPGVVATLERDGEVSVAVALVDPTLRQDRALRDAAIAVMQDDTLATLPPGSFDVIHRFRSVPGLALRLLRPEALRVLAEVPLVRRIDVDAGGTGDLNQSRPWVQADLVQSLGLTGSNCTVAVLDSGIDSDHPDLAGALLAEQCFVYNPGGGRCPNGQNQMSGPGSAEDDHGHGTHVTGTITGNGTVAPLGIAPLATIVMVKVLDYNNAFSGSSDITAGLDWVLNNRPDVDVVSMSLGTSSTFAGYCDTATSWAINLATAVNNLWAAGIPCVVSTGNASKDSQVSAPACVQNAIAVGATYDNSDGVAAFSNCGSALDLYAPGVSITATGRGGGTATMSGTSMACPHVSATVALLKQRYPTIAPTQVVSCLQKSGTWITDRGGFLRPRLDMPAVLGPDIDADAMADDWELEYFGDRGRDGTGNWDHDRMSDVAEFIAGTDPTNRSSEFAVREMRPVVSGVGLTWFGVTGRVYHVLSRTNLMAASWTTNGPGVHGADREITVTNGAGEAVQSYRLDVTRE